jgi:hypothetical protein
MSFSGDTAPNLIIKTAKSIVQESGFALSARKTQIRGQHQRQCVTGLTVNERVAIPKTQRRLLRSMLHKLEMNGASVDGRHASLDEITGHLSFLSMVSREHYKVAREQLRMIMAGEVSLAVS